jgi:hypothetical protein
MGLNVITTDFKSQNLLFYYAHHAERSVNFHLGTEKFQYQVHVSRQRWRMSNASLFKLLPEKRCWKCKTHAPKTGITDTISTSRSLCTCRKRSIMTFLCIIRKSYNYLPCTHSRILWWQIFLTVTSGMSFHIILNSQYAIFLPFWLA